MGLVLLPAKGPDYHQTTLDELWNEAESLGEPKLERVSYGKRYRATIMFSSRHGLIFAKGEGDSTHIAMGDAINNARQLGAGSDD